MKCFIGLGSNLGNSIDNLEKAAQALQKVSVQSFIRLSPVYTTAALVPENAPADWNKPYKNAVAEIQWSGSASELLLVLKMIEKDLGRQPSPRWAPRLIDVDLLTFGDLILRSPDLSIPHLEMLNRSFVLDPLKDLEPLFVIPNNQTSIDQFIGLQMSMNKIYADEFSGKKMSVDENLRVNNSEDNYSRNHNANIRLQEPVVKIARNMKTHKPLIMAIMNVTPDSFSDGGLYVDPQNFEAQILKMCELGVHYIDVGAESTRPGAQPVTAEEEWKRLQGPSEFIQSILRGKLVRSKLSLDTRHALVAKKALAFGIEVINDVSGLADPLMIEVLKNSDCQYVLTHSLTVPADPKITLPANVNIVEELRHWLDVKLDDLVSQGINLNRIIFDPGIGFGKTAPQAISLLKHINEFTDYPVRILVGHSRKSFLKTWGLEMPLDRDEATLEISVELAKKGVDILRVHDFEEHIKEFL